MDTFVAAPDSYELHQDPISILPIEITMDNAESAPKFVQNFMVRQLDDSRMELVNFDLHDIFSLDFAGPPETGDAPKDNVLKVEAPPSLRPQTESVIQYSSSSGLDSGTLPKPITEVTSYRCFKCIEKCSTVRAFRKHFKELHWVQKEYGCPKCPADFNVQDNLKIHLITDHLEGHTTSCPICGVSFIRKASLKSHVLIHQVEELIYCDQCEGEFQTESDLLRHVETHATIKIPLTHMACRHCTQEFTSLDEFKVHLDKHAESKRLVKKSKWRRRKQWEGCKCQYCGKLFPKESLLDRHERIHTGEKPFKCQLCGKGFSQKGTLRIHLNKHKGLKPYSCTLCPAKFTQKGNLRSHVNKTHTTPKGPYPTMFKCSQCACVFRKLATLNGHITKAHITIVEDGVLPVSHAFGTVKLAENHASEGLRRYTVRQKKIGDVRWYLCNTCPSRFKKPSDLIRHFRTHTLERPFKCTECGQAFSLKRTLTTHMQLHSKSEGDKWQRVEDAPPHQCKLCNAHFAKPLNLRRHMMVHTGERNFKCSTCPKSFLSKHALKEHTNCHQNFGCVTCGKRFATASLLKRHKSIHIDPRHREFSCPYCERRFRTEAFCDEHVNAEHLVDNGSDKVDTRVQDGGESSVNEIGGGKVAESDRLVKPQVGDSSEEPAQDTPVSDAVDRLPDPEQSQNFQMVYVDLTDFPQATTNPPGTLLDASSLLPSLKLQDLVLNLDTNSPAQTQSELPTLNVTSVTDVGGVIPISVIDASALNAIPYDAQVICVNCQRMFSDCYAFDSHQCGGELAAGGAAAKSDSYENKSLAVTQAPSPDVSRMKRFAYKKPLQADLRKMGEEPKQFRCDYCADYVTASEERFRKHLLLHPGVSCKTCKFCFKRFKKPSDLQRHLRVHTGERPFECELCHKRFALKSTLDSHLRTHDVSTVTRITCDVCHTNFTSRSSLKVHQLLHTGERPYPCRHCERAFRTSSIRKSHEKSRHRPVVQPEPPQQQESVVIINDWVLQQIRENGVGEIVISAQDATDVTALLEAVPLADGDDELKKSSRKAKPRKAQCDICHKLYASRDVLRKHKKALHGQNRKFPCIKCDKGYDHLEQLNLHIAKLHSGYRPYVCQYCSNSFGEEHSLKTHIKRIHQKSLAAQETTDALLGLQLDLTSENGFL